MNNISHFVFILLSAVAPITCSAYGKVGHAMTGYIASQMLTTEAKVGINELLPGFNLVDETDWLDENRNQLKRSIPGSEKWHYVNHPVCETMNADENCEGGNCITAQIERFRAVLADRNQPRDDRLFALRVIVHLIGDLHQPLHVADHDDRGGNQVKIGKGQNNLHSEWDTGLIQRMMRKTNWQTFVESLYHSNASVIASYLKQPVNIKAWAVESHHSAFQQVYQPLDGFLCDKPLSALPPLPEDYVMSSQEYLQRQLLRAGARLATVLNAAFRD